MTFWESLWRVELRALAALAFVASMIGLILATLAAVDARSGAFALGGLYGGATFLAGSVVVAVYGAPLYVFVQLHHKASWPIVILISALPAAIPLVQSNLELAIWCLACGVIVGSMTHAWLLWRPLTMRWSGP
jgi:hypothetical protein